MDYYLRRGHNWRILFGFLAVGSIVSLVGILLSRSGQRERKGADNTAQRGGSFVLPAILLLGVIMCIYVGFENGFTFFVDTLFTDVLKASTGKLALSLFWAVMIPSRFLVGRFPEHAKKLLLAAILTIPCTMLLRASESHGS